MALGPILMIFGALETGLKFYDFRWLPGGPKAEGSWPVGALWLALGPIAATKQCGVALQLAKYSSKHAGITRYEKTRCKL